MSQDIIYVNGLGWDENAEAINWEIAGFTIQNSIYPYVSGQVPTNGTAIRVNFSSFGYLHDVKILNFWGGVYFSSQTDCNIERLHIYGCVDHSLFFSDSPTEAAKLGVWNLGVSGVTAYGNYFITLDGVNTSAQCAYGIRFYVYSKVVTQSGTTFTGSYHDGCQFYDCDIEQHTQGISVDGVGVDWRTGTSSDLKFVSCYFDASNGLSTTPYGAYNLNALFDSQFIGCYFGFSLNCLYGLVLQNTDGVEFISCQVVFNLQHGVHITGPSGTPSAGLNGTANCRFIGGAIRNNSWGTPRTYFGITIDSNVENLYISGVLFGDYVPATTAVGYLPFPHPSPSQRYAINISENGSFQFTGKNVFITNNILSIQTYMGTNYGSINSPPYNSTYFTNFSYTVIGPNYGTYP